MSHVRFFIAAACAGVALSSVAAPVFTAEPSDGAIRVLADGKLFTAYVFKGARKPVLYPLTAPDGTTLNREFPVRELAGETHDHPHHRSFWFGHGDVNGIDFWAEGPGSGTVEAEGIPETASKDGRVTIRAKNKWLAPDGKVVARDERVMQFLADGDAHCIEFAITLRSESGALKLGDTKEGTMALRLLDAFSFKNAATLARNSDGVEQKAVWGKHARWMNYETDLPAKAGRHGVAVFADPGNPGAPTRWHARDYGLLAANPFGEKAFDPKSEKVGGFTIPEGGSATWHYGFAFYAGRKNPADVDNLYQQFVGRKGAAKP